MPSSGRSEWKFALPPIIALTAESRTKLPSLDFRVPYIPHELAPSYYSATHACERYVGRVKPTKRRNFRVCGSEIDCCHISGIPEGNSSPDRKRREGYKSDGYNQRLKF